MIGVSGFGASLKAPGHAHNGMEFVRIGDMAAASRGYRDGREGWRAGGFEVHVHDIHKMVWRS